MIERIRVLSPAMEIEPTDEKPVLQPIDNIKAVVFDFYGTLFISGTGDTIIEAPKESRQKALSAAFGVVFPQLSPEINAAEGVRLYQETIHNHKQSMKVDGVDYPEINILKVWNEVLEKLRVNGAASLPEQPDENLLKKLTIEFEMRDNPTYPMPDLHTALADLSDKSMLLGILSNSQFYTPLIYEAHLGSPPSKDFFDINICIWSYEERLCKPSLAFHEQLKRALAHHHNLNPADVLYVGNDMLKDIWPAHHFGFKTALFAGDARSLKWRREDEHCRDLKPDLVITRLHQLSECVRSISE